MSQLLQCPFCGGDRPYLSQTLRDGYEGKYEHDPDAYAYYIVCHSCACQGGWAKTQGNAARNWNMRVSNNALAADEDRAVK